MQPSLESVPRRIDPEFRPESPKRTVIAVLQPLEVFPHRRRPPRAIARQFGEVIPVFVVRIDRDHGVVRAASAQTAVSRVKDAILFRDELRVLLLLLIAGIEW